MFWRREVTDTVLALASCCMLDGFWAGTVSAIWILSQILLIRGWKLREADQFLWRKNCAQSRCWVFCYSWFWRLLCRLHLFPGTHTPPLVFSTLYTLLNFRNFNCQAILCGSGMAGETICWVSPHFRMVQYSRQECKNRSYCQCDCVPGNICFLLYFLNWIFILCVELPANLYSGHGLQPSCKAPMLPGSMESVGLFGMLVGLLSRHVP